MAPPAKRCGIEAAQRRVGVGDGGFGAAVAVAGGAGHAAGRNRGRPGCGPARRGGRSSRRRRRSRPARSRGCAPAGRCPARSGRRAPPRTGASAAGSRSSSRVSLAVVPPMSKATAFARPFSAATVQREDRAAGRSGFDQAHRKRRAVSTVVMPPDDIISSRGPAMPSFVRLASSCAEIARHARQHIGVGDGGRGALVFADLGADLAGERDRHARQLLGQDGAGAALVRLVGEAVQEADGDRLDLVRAQLGRDLRTACSSSASSTAPSAATRSGTPKRRSRGTSGSGRSM